jgi:dihydrolipoamide dehydrogenase
MDRFDVCVLGAGPAGYHAAIRASQLGGKVALVEEREVGGLCLSRGCIPSRALLQSVNLFNKARNAQAYGLKIGGVEADFAAMQRRAEEIVKRLTAGLREVLSSHDIQVLEGRGRLLSRNEVEVTGRGRREDVQCESLVIATGSKSVKPWETGKLVSAEEALDLEALPENLVILGGEPVGVTLASIFNGLGVKTTIVEKTPRILSQFDPEVASRLQRALRTCGIKILTGTEALGVPLDKATVSLSCGEALKADRVIVTERVGNIDGFGLSKLKVKTEKGFIKVNERMETNVRGVYAAGDIVGGSSAQEAFLQGTVTAENIMGIESTANRLIPRCVYAIPEAASLGITEEEAREKGIAVTIGRFPFSASGQALCIGEGEGFVKLIVDAKYGEVLGIHMVGPRATELVGGVSLAMSLEATVETIAETVFPHPTLSEALKEAALSSLGRSIHLPRPKRRV